MYNEVPVDPITFPYCPKCKVNLPYLKICGNCLSRKDSFKSVTPLGYYYPGWYRKGDTYEYANIPWYDISNVKDEYKLSQIIINAKGRSKAPLQKKKDIIKIMCNGLAWKLKKFHPNILKEIDILVHVPKINEKKKFNHGHYYAECLASELDKPFHEKTVTQKVVHQPIFEINASKKDLRGNVIMIVDDVFTIGKTKGCIARKLIERGAFAVYIGVIGKTKITRNIMNSPSGIGKIPLSNKCPYCDVEIEDFELHFQLCNKAPNDIIFDNFYKITTTDKIITDKSVNLDYDAILKALTPNWNTISNLIEELGVKDINDTRYLNIKLNALRRKNKIAKKELDEETLWKLM